MAIVGLGRVGRALLGACAGADGVVVVGAWNRTARPGLPGEACVGGEPPADADLVLLCVRDDAVREVAARLRPAAGAAVAHVAGAPGPELLDALPAGTPRGGWHPLQAFAAVGAPPAAGVPPFAVALRGDATTVARGRQLADALGHPSVVLPADAGPAYHAAASLASNALVALEAIALRTLSRAGISEDEGWRLLLPLVLGTVANLRDGPIPRALTGPIRRGDAGTVSLHRKVLAPDPRATAVYDALADEALALARADGLGEREAAAVARALRAAT